MLKQKFNLICTIQSAGALSGDQFRVYVTTKSMPILRKLVLPYLVKSMHYKLGL